MEESIKISTIRGLTRSTGHIHLKGICMKSLKEEDPRKLVIHIFNEVEVMKPSLNKYKVILLIIMQGG